VMLSAETAAGSYPIEAVTIMDKIAKSVEQDQLYRQMVEAQAPDSVNETASDAMTLAARQVAETLRASAIVTFTSTGSTTLRAARMRPSVPILCVTRNERVARRVMMAYGVNAVLNAGYDSFQEKVQGAAEVAVAQGLASSGDTLVMTAGDNAPGSTNVLRIVNVE
jgi:pyruvate kinase